MENEMQTKTCPKCGRTLPLGEFNKRAKSSDGLQFYCRECQHEITKTRYLLKEKLIASNPLSSYTPRELLEELKKRGYKWERMYYTQEIKYENI